MKTVKPWITLFALFPFILLGGLLFAVICAAAGTSECISINRLSLEEKITRRGRKYIIEIIKAFQKEGLTVLTEAEIEQLRCSEYKRLLP